MNSIFRWADYDVIISFKNNYLFATHPQYGNILECKSLILLPKQKEEELLVFIDLLFSKGRNYEGNHLLYHLGKTWESKYQKSRRTFTMVDRVCSHPNKPTIVLFKDRSQQEFWGRELRFRADNLYSKNVNLIHIFNLEDFQRDCRSVTESQNHLYIFDDIPLEDIFIDHSVREQFFTYFGRYKELREISTNWGRLKKS